MTFRPMGALPADGEMTTTDLDGTAILVANVGGQVFAVDDLCTHQQCSLSDGDLEGATVMCPCHLGQFDLATGAVLDGPPPGPVRTWPVRVVDGVVEVDG